MTCIIFIATFLSEKTDSGTLVKNLVFSLDNIEIEMKHIVETYLFKKT